MMEVFHTKTFTMEGTIEGQATKTLQEASEFYMAAREYERAVRDDGPFDTAEEAEREGARGWNRRHDDGD